MTRQLGRVARKQHRPRQIGGPPPQFAADEVADAAGAEPWLARMRVSILLGITTLISYGTLYYAFGVLAPGMSADTGLSLSFIYALFSAGLAVSALIAPRAGRLMDEANPGAVMAAGSLAAAVILAVWALVPGAVAFGVMLVAARLVSVLVLYEAAFVAAARLRSQSARRTITGITLVAGFASTVFWPLTQWLVTLWDWRAVTLVFDDGMNVEKARELVAQRLAGARWSCLPGSWPSERSAASWGSGSPCWCSCRSWWP